MRRVAVALAGIVLGAFSMKAQTPVQQLRALAAKEEGSALSDAVRSHPDDARELVRLLLMEAGAATTPRANRAVVVANRLARSYATVWADSFPLITVTQFSRMSVTERIAKLGADSVRRLGNAALGRGGAQAALPLWREALRRATTMKDSAGMAAALGNLGAGYFRESQLDTARLFLEHSRVIAEQIGDHRTVANGLGTLAGVAREAGDLRGAQRLYARALDLRQRIGDVRGTAADHNNLGLLAAQLGNAVEAKSHYQKARSLAKRHALSEPEAVALVNLGNAASADGDFSEASQLYLEALAIYRAAGSNADAAFVLHNIGLLEMRRGRYAVAGTRLRAALAIYVREAMVPDAVRTRRDLALLAVAVGDPQGALVHLRQAERALTSSGALTDLQAGLALARADLAVELNELGEAERLYARAGLLFAQSSNAQGQLEARQGMALLLIERERYSQALEHLETTARTQMAIGDPRPSALTRVLIGQTQLRKGDLSAARRTLQAALDSLRALGDPLGEAVALGALGDLELRTGAPLASESLYRRALARLEKSHLPSVTWELHAALGQSLRARGALGEASRELHAAIEDVEQVAGTLVLGERRATFLADKWEPYVALAMVERERGDPAASFFANERMRARQMLDLLARGRVARRTSVDTALIDQEQDLRRRMGALTQRLETEEDRLGTLRGREPGDVSMGQTREALAQAQERYAQVLLELRDVDEGHLPIVRGSISGWREIASRIAADEALVEFLVTDSTTLAFVLRADTLSVVELSVSRRTLAPLVDFARGMLNRPAAANGAAWQTPLRRLHALLVDPLEASGALAGVRRLVIVPSMELHYLPFAALISGDSGRFLIERYELQFTPSASVWARMRATNRPSGASRVLALAPRSRDLPGTRAEVEAIGAVYGSKATVLVGSAATEAAFLASAPRHQIIHLATYGVLNRNNPLFSFVELNRTANSDGRLEVHEVFGLSLNARLLVLSACQTGIASGAVSDVPAGDEWVGLVRAFLSVGVDKVIATLWPVEDRSTATLMAGLHRRLAAGQAEGAALAAAQREMLRNSKTSDPFYWAGFVLVGGQ